MKEVELDYRWKKGFDGDMSPLSRHARAWCVVARILKLAESDNIPARGRSFEVTILTKRICDIAHHTP